MDDIPYNSIPPSSAARNDGLEGYPTGSNYRARDTCANWDKSINKANLILNCVNTLLLIVVLVIVAVQLGSTDSKINDSAKSVKESLTCALINLCEGVGFGENCRTHESIHECGLASTQGVTSAWTEYFSEFSSASQHSHSSFAPPSPSSASS